jgi:hypothetical protein
MIVISLDRKSSSWFSPLPEWTQVMFASYLFFPSEIKTSQVESKKTNSVIGNTQVWEFDTIWLLGAPR